MGKKAGTIRRFIAEDIPGILEVEELSFAHPWSRQSFMEELENPSAFYWVWEVEGKVAGYLGSWFVLDEAQITNVATHPDFRKRGGAKRLIKALLWEMRERKIVSATLEVRPTNKKAQNLYKEFGFTEVGRRIGYYQEDNEDALIFEVKLECQQGEY